ncbi:hypothetical protein SK128_017046 [Halocaridina rubra]|uniref:XK-related protein n=1 Tax=Halocaridina rubra TaxID=373956 RepID=A0AAN8X4R3_HALRR
MAGIISIGTFYFDLVSDSLVAYYMHDDPDSKYWFRVTLLLIILPMVLANGFSLYWYWFDERVCEPEGACFKHPKVSNYVWVLRVLAHILLQASPLRQLDILYYGTKSTTETVLREALVDEVMEAALVTQPEDTPARPENKNRRGSRRLSFRPEGRYQNDASAPLTRPESACSRRTGGMCARGGYVALWIHAERDAANVDLLLSLVQDAPLLILHLYIMAHTLPAQAEQGKLSQTIIMQMLSVSVSLLTLAWSVASFVRAIRLAEPTMSNLSLLDLFLLTLAHFCSIAGQSQIHISLVRVNWEITIILPNSGHGVEIAIGLIGVP